MVPIADLVLAVIRRTRAGRSPFAPDKQHLHHRLLEIGHSQRRAVLIMWMWAALVAGSTVVISLYTGPLMWSVIGGRGWPDGGAHVRPADASGDPHAAPGTTTPERCRDARYPGRTPVGGPASACATFHKHPDSFAATQNGRHRHDDRQPRDPLRGRVCARLPAAFAAASPL